MFCSNHEFPDVFRVPLDPVRALPFLLLTHTTGLENISILFLLNIVPCLVSPPSQRFTFFHQIHVLQWIGRCSLHRLSPGFSVSYWLLWHFGVKTARMHNLWSWQQVILNFDGHNESKCVRNGRRKAPLYCHFYKCRFRPYTEWSYIIHYTWIFISAHAQRVRKAYFILHKRSTKEVLILCYSCSIWPRLSNNSMQ